jgi:RNA polymerase-binding transcription factor DksA
MIDIAFFKEQLEADLAVITKELSSLGIRNPENREDWIATPQDVQDEADSDLVADQNEDWEERQATLAALETQYNDIQRALQKIEKGTYGICEISGEEIEEARLNANPAARTSMAHMDDEQDLAS